MAVVTNRPVAMGMIVVRLLIWVLLIPATTTFMVRRVSAIPSSITILLTRRTVIRLMRRIVPTTFIGWLAIGILRVRIARMLTIRIRMLTIRITGIGAVRRLAIRSGRLAIGVMRLI